MPRGDKSSYTDKQQRQAEHIEESYKERGVGEDEAESRAWATVNRQDGGGKLSGSARGKKKNIRPTTTAKTTRSKSAKKAASTRKKKVAPRKKAASRVRKKAARKK